MNKHDTIKLIIMEELDITPSEYEAEFQSDNNASSHDQL